MREPLPQRRCTPSGGLRAGAETTQSKPFVLKVFSAKPLRLREAHPKGCSASALGFCLFDPS